MAVIKHDSAPFEPYARLMTMLGDQLITDKKVAIIELIKNCYDADAKLVSVAFYNIQNIGLNDLPQNELAYVEIKDDGIGMSLDTIKNVWLRPATPNKMSAKRKDNRTRLGRIIQGEKGIGRFAIHKLGTKIELYTRTEGQEEVKLLMNFSDYDPDQSNLFNQQGEYKLLQDVTNDWYVNSPAEVITSGTGTVLRIYLLRENWSTKDFGELYRSIQRMIPPIDNSARQFGIIPVKDFDVFLSVNDKPFVAEEGTSFNDVIERAQYRITGSVSKDGILAFQYKSTNPYREFNRELNLLDRNHLAHHNYSSYAITEFLKREQKLNCGGFDFAFYAFDLDKPDKTILNEDLKRFIKENFVYVLRDGVRVYPYGEKGIDWLSLDKLRATKKAGQFISYNDLTGFVYITQEGNPKLKDSTNRQGLIDIDGAFEAFTSLVTAVTEIFNAEIKIDKLKKNIQTANRLKSTKDKLQQAYISFEKRLLALDDKESLEKAKKFVDAYVGHFSVIQDRMQTVEDLAGLGMAVERSSHDSLRLLSLMKMNLKNVSKKAKKHILKDEELISFIDDMTENIDIVYDDMQMIQPLFKVQRKSIKDISIHESCKKVFRYFRTEINDEISCKIILTGDDLIIRTNAGLILQVLINLVDNAIYWIKSTSTNIERELYIQINSIDNTCIIADNGPGVRDDISSMIFQEFVSMKSNGRGLGLYIVQELLGRIDATIELIEDNKYKILPGANFKITFNPNVNQK